MKVKSGTNGSYGTVGTDGSGECDGGIGLMRAADAGAKSVGELL